MQAKWVPPDLGKERGEFERHAPLFGISADELKIAIENGKLQTMDADLFNNLDNTQMRDVKPGDLKELIKIGKENAKDYEGIIRGFKEGSNFNAPIVVHQAGNERVPNPYLIAGNTRLIAARAFDITPDVWYVEIPPSEGLHEEICQITSIITEDPDIFVNQPNR